MEYVLIIFLSAVQAVGGFSHEFNTHDDCLSALEKAKTSERFEYGFCAPKGESQ